MSYSPLGVMFDGIDQEPTWFFAKMKSSFSSSIRKQYISGVLFDGEHFWNYGGYASSSGTLSLFSSYDPAYNKYEGDRQVNWEWDSANHKLKIFSVDTQDNVRFSSYDWDIWYM